MCFCERERERAGKTLISSFSFRDAAIIKQEQEKHCSVKAKKRDHSPSERWAVRGLNWVRREREGERESMAAFAERQHQL